LVIRKIFKIKTRIYLDTRHEVDQPRPVEANSSASVPR
jgi:hypothetical protein